MKTIHGIKKAAVAALIIISMLLSALAMTSCGGNGPRVNTEEVPDNMKSEERRKTQNDISEDDRAAYISKLNKYVRYLNGDYSVIEDLYPEVYWERIGSTPEEFVENLKKSEAENGDSAVQKYGEGYKVTYSIESEKNYELLIESLKSTLKENFGIAPERVSKAYNVYINLTISGPKNNSTDSFYLMPTLIDGNWYLVNERGSFN